MCGIFGYVGEKQAKEILLGGLRQLEYRGYDSASVFSCGKQVECAGIKVLAVSS